MEWIFAGLTVGALICGTAIVLDYFRYSTGLSPRIHRFLEDAAGLNVEAGAEIVRATGTHGRVEAKREVVADLRRQASEMRDRLQAERERGRRLQIAVFRKRLKSRQRLVTA